MKDYDIDESESRKYKKLTISDPDSGDTLWEFKMRDTDDVDREDLIEAVGQAVDAAIPERFKDAVSIDLEALGISKTDAADGPIDDFETGQSVYSGDTQAFTVNDTDTDQ